ncbi:MAG: mechanosensitive ion channel domain-containing protein [Phycisphaerae bacterium]
MTNFKVVFGKSFVWNLFSVVLVSGLTLPVFAGPTTTASSKPTTDAANIESTIQAITAQITRVTAGGEIKQGDKKKLLEIYNDALGQVQTAVKSKARGDKYEKERINAPSDMAKIKEKLAEPMVKHVLSIPPKESLSQLEQRLGQAQADLGAARKKLTEIEDANPRGSLRTELPKMMATYKQQLDEVRKQQIAPLADEAVEFRIAHRTRLRAKRNALQQQIETCEIALRTLDLRRELNRAEQSLAKREVAEMEKQFNALQEIVNARRQAEASKSAEEAKRKLANAIPQVRKLAEDNAKLAKERSDPQGPAARIGKVSAELKKAQYLLERLKYKFEGDGRDTGEKGIKAKVQAAGVTNSISLLLRKERFNLPDTRELNQILDALQPQMGFIQTRLIQLGEDRDWYFDTDARVTEFMGGLRSKIKPGQRLEIENAVREQVKIAYEYNEALFNDYNSYMDKLGELDIAERELIKKSKEYADYIDENIFWFRSTSAINLSSFTNTWEAACRLLNPKEWLEVMHGLGCDLKDNPIISAITFLILAGALFLKRRLYLKFHQMDNSELSCRKETFAFTLKTFVQTMLIACIWPGVILFIAWQLASNSHATDFIKEIAAGLKATAIIFLTLEVLMKLCLPQGIAERHFEWSPRMTRAIRVNLFWLMLIGLPLVFIMTSLDWENDELGKDSLGRFAFIVLLAAFALFTKNIIGPIRLSLQRSVASRWEGWGTWTHYVWYPLTVGIPLVLALISAMGYYYTAMELAWRMLLTVWILLGMLIVREMLLRRIFLASKDFTISTQTRKLLDSFAILILAILLWQVWVDVLPALGKLKQVDLKVFKLADLLLAIVVLFMTYIAGKNIPGLLEITILPRLTPDSGLRFAITTVSRYLIIILGVSIALTKLGYTLASIQWLLAAMMVGLSFGLQEIFANLISGLIILFERPMRVGDTVTVGDVTGKVTRIQIRATTIVDADRKELIVPNKEFITGRVINWTLSDRILRLAIPVGIAYGSDTDTAQKLLMQVAQANPKVMSDPPPSAVFIRFGESAIEFELGVFTTVDNFIILRHELNTAVNNAFQEAGIQIPFPQQEIHVKTIKDYLPRDTKSE